jgi:hypothetical protein
MNDDNVPDAIRELTIFTIHFQTVHNFFTKVGSNYVYCLWNEITIDAAVLGELSAEALARIKAEDNRNFETRREEGFAKAFAESAMESESEGDEPAGWKESDRRSSKDESACNIFSMRNFSSFALVRSLATLFKSPRR